MRSSEHIRRSGGELVAERKGHKYSITSLSQPQTSPNEVGESFDCSSPQISEGLMNYHKPLYSDGCQNENKEIPAYFDLFNDRLLGMYLSKHRPAR